MNNVMKILLVVFSLLLFTDLVYLNYRIFADNTESASNSAAADITTENADNTKNADNIDNVESTEGCGLVCQKVITDKVATEVAKLAEEWEKKLVVSKQSTASRQQPTIANEPKIVVIPIASSGETNAVSWTEVKPSEFYFDLTNYPGAKEVRFEAYLLADQGGSKVYARLYDVTNNRGVDYSDIQTNSSSYTRIQSSKTSIWRGNNKYIVQLKSENGTVAKIKDAKLVVNY